MQIWSVDAGAVGGRKYGILTLARRAECKYGILTLSRRAGEREYGILTLALRAGANMVFWRGGRAQIWSYSVMALAGAKMVLWHWRARRWCYGGGGLKQRSFVMELRSFVMELADSNKVLLSWSWRKQI